MAPLLAAPSGVPRPSIVVPTFVRAHARPDACVANSPCTDRARARTNKALQHMPATAEDATPFQLHSSVLARATSQHTRSTARDKPPHTRAARRPARSAPPQHPQLTSWLPSAYSHCSCIIFCIPFTLSTLVAAVDVTHAGTNRFDVHTVDHRIRAHGGFNLYTM